MKLTILPKQPTASEIDGGNLIVIPTEKTLNWSELFELLCTELTIHFPDWDAFSMRLIARRFCKNHAPVAPGTLFILAEADE